MFFLLVTVIQPICQSEPQTKIEPLTQSTPKEWDAIFDIAKKSVVQIFTYSGSYDIFRPYKTPSVGGSRGTGFFLDHDGYMLTNFHVVANALAIFIQTTQTGKEQFRADIIGVHPERDLALIKLSDSEHARLKNMLNVEKLPSLPFVQDSDLTKETQKILLVGYPLGEENIKASLGDCSGREYYPRNGSMIQTTVPTNHGNSGGPYFNKNGEIVGVCAAKIDSDEVDNVAYFIPANTVKIVLDDLYAKKITSNPFWGCNPIPTTEHTNKYLQCKRDGGVYLAEVYEGSLTEEYGFKKGDIVYTINGLLVDHFGHVKLPAMDTKIEIYDYLSRFPLGSTVIFELYRDGQERVISITSKETERFKVNPFYPWLQEPLDYEVIGGLVLVQLTTNHLDVLKKHTPSITKYLKPKKRLEARIIVTDVLPSSPAFKSRCFTMDGDRFVKQINGQSIATIQDFRDAIIAGKDGEFITIETDAGSLIALSIKEILEQEAQLIQQYAYPKSGLIDVLTSSRK